MRQAGVAATVATVEPRRLYGVHPSRAPPTGAHGLYQLLRREPVSYRLHLVGQVVVVLKLPVTSNFLGTGPE